MKNKLNQPWLDESGDLLPDDILRVISKKWDQNTWDRYLDHYCEDKANEPVIDFVDEIRLENLANSAIEPTFLSGSEHSKMRLKYQIMAAMKSLSSFQKLTIEKIFFENWTDSQVAEYLGISKKTVFTHKSRALAHLKNNHHLMSDFLHIVRGQEKLRSAKSKKDEEVDI